MPHIISDEQWRDYQRLKAERAPDTPMIDLSGYAAGKLTEPDGSVVYTRPPYMLAILSGEVERVWLPWA